MGMRKISPKNEKRKSKILLIKFLYINSVLITWGKNTNLKLS